MKSYIINELQATQKVIFEEISDYIRSRALKDSIYTVELNLFKMLLKLGLEFIKELIERHNEGKVAGAIIKDQIRLPYHGLKSTTYLSIFGEVKINRAYYWTSGNKGFFPLDARLNLPKRRYSYLLCKWSQMDIAEDPYDKAVNRYAELFDIPVSKLGQENVAQESGDKFDLFYQNKPPFDPEVEGQVIGVEADGKGVRMIPSERTMPADDKPSSPRRAKGEKSGGLRREAIATADFTFNPEPRTPEEVADFLMKETSEERKQEVREERKRRHQNGEGEPRQSLNTHVAATMDGKQAAFEKLAERVLKRDPTGNKPIIALMDGDPSLEKEMRRIFKANHLHHRMSALILDIMHTMEYVWEAGTALYGEKSDKRRVWVKEHTLSILKGRVGRVIGGMKQMITRGKLKPSQKKQLNKAITYFENHKHMMRYDVYLAKGYPIATGLIEGTCGSLIKDRADRSGARWSKKGIQVVLNNRAIIKNGDWDDYWDCHMESEGIRLYGKPDDIRLAA